VDENVVAARGWPDKPPPGIGLVELHLSLKHRAQIPC
jgi:hypothetical protein